MNDKHPTPADYELHQQADAKAHEWVFETNGHKWSNNDDTAGDNFLSFKKGYLAGHASRDKEIEALKERIKELEGHTIKPAQDALTHNDRNRPK